VLEPAPAAASTKGGMARLIPTLCSGATWPSTAPSTASRISRSGIIELSTSSGCGQGGCHVICDDIIYFAERCFRTVRSAGRRYGGRRRRAVLSVGGNDTDHGLDVPMTR